MASTLVFLLQLLLLVSPMSASHYYGATMTYTAKGRNPDGTFRVDIRYRGTFRGCGSDHRWNCYRGNCGTRVAIQRGGIDSNNSGPWSNRWCETQTVTTRNVPSDQPFALRESSCCWVSTRNNMRSWSLLTHVDLGRRSDTGRPNRSPDVDIVPVLRVPGNCPRAYKLMAFDPDGDQVLCRYGTPRSGECNRCSQPAGFRLDQGSCTLHYVSTSYTGVYGFEMVVEDFPNRPITLAYTDGSRSARNPLNGRRGRRSINPWWFTSAPNTTQNWWWQQQQQQSSTPPPATTRNPYWLHTNTQPQPTTSSNWWWWWRQQQTSTPPPATTRNPYWLHTSTYPQPTTSSNWWWWWRQQQTSTPPPATTRNPYWLHTSTHPQPTTSSNWWWWWRQQQSSTPSPATTRNPYWLHTSTYPQPTTSSNWWWWWRQQQTSTPRPTSITTATTTTSTSWWGWRTTTTTQRPITSTRQVRTRRPFVSTTQRPYVSTASLSKLPLQFSVIVDAPAPSCNEGTYLPRFLPPTPRNGERLHAEVSKEVEIRVRAQATHSRLQSIIMSGPLNVTKHRTTRDEFVIRWTPVPDELGDHFPICFAVESVTGSRIYQSEMRCVIVEVGRGSVKAHVICGQTTMTVQVEKSSFRDLHEDHLRLSDPSNTACSLQTHSNTTHVIAVIPLNACGTQIEEDDDNLLFKNEITTTDDTTSLITRHHLLEVAFYCQYPKRGNVTLGFTAHRSNVTVKEVGFGTFTYQFEFYNTNRFNRMIDPSSYPLEYDIGDKIYMEIEATSLVNNTELFVESCRAAPYDNPNYTPKYSIIENGCKVDSTVEIYPPSHQRRFKFSMEAFKFIGLHDQVYISCSVIVCEAGNPNTRCSQGCTNSTSASGRRLQKREAVIQTAMHFVSQGPLRLRRSPESAVTNLNLNLVFIAGCLLAAVAIISAVVIHKTKASTIKYQQLPSFET